MTAVPDSKCTHLSSISPRRFRAAKCVQLISAITSCPWSLHWKPQDRDEGEGSSDWLPDCPCLAPEPQEIWVLVCKVIKSYTLSQGGSVVHSTQGQK